MVKSALTVIAFWRNDICQIQPQNIAGNGSITRTVRRMGE